MRGAVFCKELTLLALIIELSIIAGCKSAPKSLRIINDLQITISIARQEFRVQEPILVSWQIRNVGKDPKTLCLKKHRNTAFWQFGIRSKEYDIFPAVTRMIAIRSGRPTVTESDFITLVPGEVYQGKLNLLDYEYGEKVFSKPGSHHLYVTYENFLDGKELGLNAWRCRHGLGPESNYVSFRIREENQKWGN